MKRLALLMGLCMASPAFALEPAELSGILGKAPYLEADFTQEKAIAALSRPLTTTGHLALAQGRGVLWQIETPYAIGYFLAADKVVELTGGQRLEQDAAKLPWLAQVARVMNALLAGDTLALSELFTLELSGTATDWRLHLVPRAAELRSVIASIELGGGATLDRLNLVEANGDKTAIRFANTRTPAALPTALQEFVSPP